MKKEEDIAAARIDSNGREWLVGGRDDRIRWKGDVFSRLMQEMRAGYRRYAWGGAEIGGILVGAREDCQVRVDDFLLAPCSHEHGPSFELSEGDKEQFRDTLDSVQEAVGWFHSVSNRQELLNAADERLLAEFFPEQWQFVLVIRRSKDKEPVPSLFVRSGSQIVRAMYAIVPVR